MKMEGIERVAVVGAGLMGHSIALCFAAGGYDVVLTDVDAARLEAAMSDIRATLAMLVEQGLMADGIAASVPGRIHTASTLAAAVEDADFVVESVYEDLDLKLAIFGELDRCSPPRSILASNTSSFMPSQLAPATRRADRVLVANWWNPAHLLPLVEVVRGPETSEATVATTTRLLESLGKRPVVLQRESLGFVGNRLQFALLREALSIVEHGVATPEDVDTVVMSSFGRRLAVAGPFAVFDIAGWDTIARIAAELFPDLAAGSRPPAILEEMVGRGHLGLKSGRGFYPWDEDRASSLRRRLTRALAEIDRL